MRSLTDFLKGLPGVMPRKAYAAVLEGSLLTEAELADVHTRDNLYATREVGPDAAAAILAAYRAGRLPMNARSIPGEAPEAEAYLARRETLLAEIAERKRRSDASRDSSLVRETDFLDERFMDQIFHRHMGEGETSMTLAGIVVTKTLTRHPSNSGKSQGWSTTFSWTGSDGQRRSSGREAPEASNRRNDPDRNWGLHE
jgi:hypothetical protein